MLKGLLIFFVTLMIGLNSLVAVRAANSQSSVIDSERLGHSGRWLVDHQGRVVLIRGFNMINKLPPYTVSSTGFGEEDAALLKKEGFNGIRVGVIYGAVEPEPGRYDEKYLENIEETVRMLSRHGIWSLLDFHQDLYGPLIGGEGFPEWATLIDGLPTGPSHGFPADYIQLPATARAFDNFWKNKAGPGGVGLQDRYAAAWAHVANRFAKVPGVLGYELMNEPFPGSAWKECVTLLGCPEFDKLLSAFNTKVSEAIRKRDVLTLIFYEPNVIFDDDIPTHVTRPLNDAQLGFAFHTYANESRGLGMAEQYSAQTGTALLLTEWGAMTDPAVMRARTHDLDDAMMSWLYWAWANKTPYEIPGGGLLGDIAAGGQNHGIIWDLQKPRTPGNVHEDRLDALARPFPQAVAGTPQSFSYDPKSRVFQLTYFPFAVAGRSLSLEAKTEVFLPERQYPKGYKVSATGAKIVSEGGARVLRLVNEPGVPLVTVKVEPTTRSILKAEKP